MLELPAQPLDYVNVTLPIADRGTRRRLDHLREVPRMSTFAIAALINRAVSSMPDDCAFVNVGIWNGFTLLSGMAGNPGKICVGIDDFSQFGGPRDAFGTRFDTERGPRHAFHECDYHEYFARLHAGPIGVYIYDGHHAYDHQLEGLRIAEPFLAEHSLVLIDDTNWPEPRDATLDFIRGSAWEYAVLLDEKTCRNGHPSYWNGLMILERGGPRTDRSRTTGAAGIRMPRSHTLPHEGARDSTVASVLDEHGPRAAPSVSIVIDSLNSAAGLEDVLDSALHQSYGNVEVIAVDAGSVDGSRDIIRRRNPAVRSLLVEYSTQAAALSAGLSVSDGDVVLFCDPVRPLAHDAVEKAIDEGPEPTRWFRRRRLALRDIESVVAPGASFILIDDDNWGVGEFVDGRRRIPFLERDGHYAGRPVDDRQAVAELDRLRRLGALFVVIAWPASWWLDHYSGLREHLNANARRILENDRVVVFELSL
ncbi:MAG: glycosyltransferase [Acidobacteria bacterium]|nr:glycosyltransferase [Acidobacteriota bacterium]